MKTQVGATSLKAEDNLLLEAIATAVRKSPSTFEEGGRLLDEGFSVGAFRTRRVQVLRSYRESRRQRIAQRKLVIEFIKEQTRLKPLELGRDLPGFQHPAQAGHFLGALVKAGLARWVDGDGSCEHCICGLTELSQRKPLPVPRYEPVVLTSLHDPRWKRAKGGDPACPSMCSRMSTAARELIALESPPTRSAAMAICLIAFVLGDPEANEVQPHITQFQAIPWLPDFDGGDYDARAMSFVLTPIDGNRRFLDAARAAVTRLKALGVWPRDVHRVDEHVAPDSEALSSAVDRLATQVGRASEEFTSTCSARDAALAGAVEAVAARPAHSNSESVRLEAREASGLDLLTRLRTPQVETSTPEPTAESAPRKRKCRVRGTAPRGWIYLNEAAKTYGQATSSLQEWSLKLLGVDRVKDEDSGQIRVKEASLRRLLQKKGRLPG